MQDSRRYIINGGKRLEGAVRVQSAKNALTKQIVASLLTDEPCIFENLPKISELDSVLDMLQEIGTEFEWLGESTLKIQTPTIKSNMVPYRYSGFNRIPILLLGPLIHRIFPSIGSVTTSNDTPGPLNLCDHHLLLGLHLNSWLRRCTVSTGQNSQVGLRPWNDILMGFSF